MKIQKLKIFIIYLISVVLVLTAIFFYYDNFIKNPENINLFNNITKYNSDNLEEEIINNQSNKQTITGSYFDGDSSSDRSSSSDSSTATNSGSSCSYRQISYSIVNLNEFSICNLEEENLCVDKTAKCSVEVINFDKTIGGEFEIKFSFYNEENRKDIIASLFSNTLINPNKKQNLETELIIKGENANKNISCYYTATKIPKEKVCV